MKKFNVTGLCVPEKHYMADISRKLDQIIKMIEDGAYFTINRSRQYGKTTTLSLLEKRLSRQYHVIWISFEGMGEIAFQNDDAFVKNFIRKTAREMEYAQFPPSLVEKWKESDHSDRGIYQDAFDYLSQRITGLCRNSGKDIILMIDEVDKSSDNQIFLNFLGMLRNKYLFAQNGRDATFKSVILAGVYDIKNLKLKLRPDEEKKYNSPWNIAADFKIDMSLSETEIASMLEDYESEHHTGMDIGAISRELRFYTNGYPVLVSCLCKWIDEEGGQVWTVENLQNAQKSLLKTRNTLFDDLIKNVENNKEIKTLIFRILYDGMEYVYNPANPIIHLGVMLGIFCEKDHKVAISNLIFETYLYDYTISMKSMEDQQNHFYAPVISRYVENGRLNMPHVLSGFRDFMWSEYREEDESFIEQQGRLLFLCFLKPIINGVGFYYVEPETRDHTRMDIVVVYGREEHIIELKIWRGKKYRLDGIRQLENYLDGRNAQTGYLVSFSFLKNKKNVCGWLSGQETKKHIFEVVI